MSRNFFEENVNNFLGTVENVSPCRHKKKVVDDDDSNLLMGTEFKIHQPWVCVCGNAITGRELQRICLGGDILTARIPPHHRTRLISLSLDFSLGNQSMQPASSRERFDNPDKSKVLLSISIKSPWKFHQTVYSITRSEKFAVLILGRISSNFPHASAFN